MAFAPYTVPAGNVHPRMVFTGSNLSTYRARVNGAGQAAWSELARWCDRALGRDVDDFHKETATDLAALSAGWLMLDGAGRSQLWANHAYNIAIDLGGLPLDLKTEAANDLGAMAWVYDWLYAYLGVEQRRALRTSIANRVDERLRKTSDNERYGWGHSPDNTFNSALALMAIMGDGSVNENARWRGWWEDTVLSWIDDETDDCFFGCLRHYGNDDGGTPFGSASYNEIYWDYIQQFLFSARTAVDLDYFSEGWVQKAIDWFLWMWRGDDKFFRCHENRRIAHYRSEVSSLASWWTTELTDSDRREHAQWLFARTEARGFYSMNAGNFLWRFLFGDTSIAAVRPTIARMGGAHAKVFEKVARIVVREGWGDDDVAVAIQADREHAGVHQWRGNGDFQVYASGAPLFYRLGWDKNSAETYWRSDDPDEAGAQWTAANRILATSAVSVLDEDLVDLDPKQIAFKSISGKTCFGRLDAGGAFDSNDGKVAYADCGGQLWPIAADYLSRASKVRPVTLTEALGAPYNRYPDLADLLVRPVVETAKYVHFALDLLPWYPGSITGNARKIERHFYFVLPGSIPGWDRMLFFVWDRIDADTVPAAGKLTKRVWLTTGFQPTGSFPSLVVLNDASAPKSKAFVDVLLPASAEVAYRGPGLRDLEGNHYPQHNPADAEDGLGKDLYRTEINPPAARTIEEFLTVIQPCAASTAAKIPVSLVSDATKVGILAGLTEDEIEFAIPREYPGPQPSNTPPTATIDVFPSSPQDEGDLLTFVGHGTDTDGDVIAHEWSSDLDGVFSREAALSYSGLSVGAHTISYRVRDNDGEWSTPDTDALTVAAVAGPPGTKPTAAIVSILPNPAEFGVDTVVLTGSGTPNDSTIDRYRWRSSLIGDIGEVAAAVFNWSSAPVGNHTIYLSVREADGDWSDEVSSGVVLKVVDPDDPPDPGDTTPPAKPAKPAVNYGSRYTKAIITPNSEDDMHHYIVQRQYQV